MHHCHIDDNTHWHSVQLEKTYAIQTATEKLHKKHIETK